MDNALRRRIHPAEKILSPYVKEGMRTVDFGCGFGHYSLGMARIVGSGGLVTAVDVQQKMLDKTMERAKKAGVENIINLHLCRPDSIGIDILADFVLASNSIHETPEPAATLAEIYSLIKPGGLFLFLEPGGHLSLSEFENELCSAVHAGFILEERLSISRQYAVLLRKPEVK